jgi:hypothetical protein
VSQAVRRLLAQVPWHALIAEEHHHVRYLLQLASLHAASQAGGAAQERMHALKSLCMGPQPAPDSLQRVAKAVAAACGGQALFSAQEMSEALARDAANGYGIMAPHAEGVCTLSRRALGLQSCFPICS